ncbi:hypothetical protein [Bacteroides pyogenes]|uniref:hypothetical protein n=1 Tax=Bacteroides pyogenes TaxID=310300 RepID=UPI002FD87C60
MNKEQELRLALNLASRNIDEAKKAYEFVIGDKEAKVENEVGNGVYLIYEDGHHEPFTGKNDKDGIKSVSIVFDGHSFAVALKDLPKKYALVSNIDECEEGSPLYKGEVDAIFEWDAESHTKHIVEVGTDIPLKDGEFIPTAAMLIAMYRMREHLNKALEYAGGEPLKTDDYYWSSSEYGQYHSWILNFGGGYLGNRYKCYSTYVRPCTAFNL